MPTKTREPKNAELELKLLRELCEKGRTAIARAAQLGLSIDHDIVRVLGISRAYWRRFLIELRKPGVPDKRFVPQRLIASIEAICDLIADRLAAPRVESIACYQRRVSDEVSRLSPGDRHILVSIPPPLECTLPDVRRLVVEAALAGVHFDYYFPDSESVKAVFDRATRNAADARRSRALAAFEETFGWLRDAAHDVEFVMLSLLHEAFKMDRDHGLPRTRGPGPRQAAVRERVRFIGLKWIFLSFNEKLVLIEKKAGRSAPPRKEVLMPAHDQQNGGSRETQPHWMSFDFPMSQQALSALLAMAAGEPLDWNRVGFSLTGAPAAPASSAPRDARAARRSKRS